MAIPGPPCHTIAHRRIAMRAVPDDKARVGAGKRREEAM